jgi:hypothetical protein
MYPIGGHPNGRAENRSSKRNGYRWGRPETAREGYLLAHNWRALARSLRGRSGGQSRAPITSSDFVRRTL